VSLDKRYLRRRERKGRGLGIIVYLDGGATVRGQSYKGIRAEVQGKGISAKVEINYSYFKVDNVSINQLII
jgi:hypothetical protein